MSELGVVGTVHEIPDFKLVERAVRNARRQRSRKEPRWVHVSHVFALGSTYATQLCRRFDLDPDEMVK